MKKILMSSLLFCLSTIALACPDTSISGDYICQGKNDSKVKVTLQKIGENTFVNEDGQKIVASATGETTSNSGMGFEIITTAKCVENSLVVATEVKNSETKMLIGQFTKEYTMASDSVMKLKISTQQAGGNFNSVDVVCKKL